MLIRSSQRILFAPVAAAALVLVFLLLRFYNRDLIVSTWPTDVTDILQKHPTSSSEIDDTEPSKQPSSHNDDPNPTSNKDVTIPDLADAKPDALYREIFSLSTPDKKYFNIDFVDFEAINPNIIPHPTLPDTWIMVAQQQRSIVDRTVWCAEIACNAQMINGTLTCVSRAMNLPIGRTPGDKCGSEGFESMLRYNIGPHDARVFYGPDNPYIIYGSNSELTCFGMWATDFRLMVDWGLESYKDGEFRLPTELQRPGKYLLVEKNWFMFWDKDKNMYIHNDLSPKRMFAKLEFNGTVGPDLAPAAAEKDEKCMEKFMPKLAPDHESIHQATNSISITLCKRADSSCKQDDSNTFAMHIFHHKTYYSFHGDYMPYVVLIQQVAPFALHAISTKPLWIHGKEKGDPNNTAKDMRYNNTKQMDQNEMLYITSIGWKNKGQKYHGYLDDVLFLGFGIEDQRTAGMDVLGGDLLQDLGKC